MIRTASKARRVQKARFESGKLGWARAVRRFVAKSPGHRGELLPWVRGFEDPVAQSRHEARVRRKLQAAAAVFVQEPAS